MVVAFERPRERTAMPYITRTVLTCACITTVHGRGIIRSTYFVFRLLT